MDELLDTQPRKPASAQAEAHALQQLLGFINTPLESPPGRSIPIQPATPPPAPLPSQRNPVAQSRAQTLFFTGRICAGKDFCANKIGATIFGFADPIYSLAEYLLNIKVNAESGKDAPGVRQFLQTVGQWGRAEISERNPHTVERSMFCMMVRSLANQNCLASGADWGSFGLRADLWIDGLIKRLSMQPAGRRIVVTNCRFDNEYRKLHESGFQHWHITCSAQTWSARLADRKLSPASAELSDVSEQLATQLDDDLRRKLSAHPAGPRMRVIWSDDNVPPPSPRIFTLAEFIAAL